MYRYAKCSDDVIFDRCPIDCRAEVDAILKEIYGEWRYHAMAQNSGREVIELLGFQKQRSEQLNAATKHMKATRRTDA